MPSLCIRSKSKGPAALFCATFTKSSVTQTQRHFSVLGGTLLRVVLPTVSSATLFRSRTGKNFNTQVMCSIIYMCVSRLPTIHMTYRVFSY